MPAAPVGGCWPTPEQEWLLQAALLPAPAGRRAWDQWSAAVNVQTLDHGSNRLLPLLYHNLRALGVEHPELDRLRGLYRQAWYKNQILLHRLSQVLQPLTAAGVPVLVLKGAALLLGYYHNLGLRSMTDLDVLVPTRQAAEAERILLALGWQPRFRAVHSQGFVDQAGRELDLHWLVLPECPQLTADDDFWAAARPLEVAGVPALALHPADQFLHVCVHGLAWNWLPPLRWVADAVIVLRATPDFDWARLTAQARQRELVLPLREALNYLARLVQAPIPPAVLEELGRERVAAALRLDFRARTAAPERRGPFLAGWAYWREYTRWAESHRERLGPLGLLRFLRHLWGVPHTWQVPWYALTGLTRRALGRASQLTQMKE
jgi:hypothetical protein